MAVDKSNISPVKSVDADGNDLIFGASALAPNATEADQNLVVDDAVGGRQFGAFHADTTHVFWTSEDAECRVTFDDSPPLTTNGHIIPLGSSGIWTKATAAAAKFIRTGAANAEIAASQFK